MKQLPASCAPAARRCAHGWTASRRTPGAWLAVERGARWFHIRAGHLDIPISFTPLGAIFASVVSEAPGAEPLLTLPVR